MAALLSLSGVGGSLPAFDPLLLAPSAWYKPESLSVLSDGDPVAAWPDSSGNSKSLVQSTAAQKPIYKINIYNGRPAVSFDGVDDWMQTGPATTIGQTFFVVAGHLDVAVFSFYRRLFDQKNAASETNSAFGVAAAASYNGDGALKRGFATANIYVNGANTLLASPLAQQRVWSGTADSAATGVLYVSTYDASGAQPFYGYIAELIVYPSALAAADRQSVENYLRTKFGTP